MKRSAAKRRIPAEVLAVIILLAAAGIAWLAISLVSDSGAVAVVRIDGEEAGRYSLSKDGVYFLNGGSNTLVISDGAAWISEADCPDKICVSMGKIKSGGQVITCLPNRLTVTIEGADDGVDIVT